jgi:hypothetical protein
MCGFLVKKLFLVSPLRYKRDDSLLFSLSESAGEETLFFMDLDPTQSRSIEPDRRAFPGRLMAAGVLSPEGKMPARGAGSRTGHGNAELSGPPAETFGLFELPAGTYLFAQVREPMDMETLIDMGIAVQQEGLWERLSLDNCLYIRRLFEDGHTVTQVFRAVSVSGA